MTKKIYSIYIMVALLLGVAGQSVQAQTVNTWRGDAMGGDWNEPYKWKLNHPPVEGEAAHFRDDNSVISINRTIDLDNGMHLYGQELTLKGNGNINLMSQIPHERTVNIPASATGFANMTLCDNLSLNGRISLSAKGFGTSASKGSLTLKDRSTVTGGLVIGNQGVGSGQIYVKDNATFRITSLELNTDAKKGGLAEIHILGGTVRIETSDNLFKTLMDDPSRKIIIGDSGTLRIESNIPIAQKKQLIKQLITSGRLIAASGCQLTTPILQDEMLIARAQSSAKSGSNGSILANIDNLSETSSASTSSTSDLGDLVKALHKEVVSSEVADKAANEKDDSSNTKAAGSIVFVLLFAGGLGGLGWWVNKRYGILQKFQPAMTNAGQPPATNVTEATVAAKERAPVRAPVVERAKAPEAPKVEKPAEPVVSRKAQDDKVEAAQSSDFDSQAPDFDSKLYERGAMEDSQSGVVAEKPVPSVSAKAEEAPASAEKEPAPKASEPQKKAGSDDWLSGHMDLLSKLK